MSDSDVDIPASVVDVQQMNRIMRHRLRNLCAGVKMAVDRISEQTRASHPQVGDRCSIIVAELDNLQNFSERMDLLFDALPPPSVLSLFEVVSLSRRYFVQQYPLCSIRLEGEEADISLKHGSWLLVMLRELIHNAGEAAGANGDVALNWQVNGNVTFTVSNTGEPIPQYIPTSPPRAFFTEKGRHDGMGLAIVHRVCTALHGTMSIVSNQPDAITISVDISAEEIVDEQTVDSDYRR